MNNPEIIDISELDSTELGIQSNDELKSTNFGPGIELLMNDKKGKSVSMKGEHSDGELLDLEKELNDLTANVETVSFAPKVVSTHNFRDKQSVEFNLDDPKIEKVELGYDTSTDNVNQKTWDGFNKFSEVPINPDSNFVNTQNLSKEELLREKFSYLRKLEQLEKKGVELTKKYTIDSNLMEMMGEYELIVAEKEKQNSVKFQGNMLSALINGVEFFNGKFDPFDFKLDGWSEQFNENISDYDEIFGELHDKYKSSAKMAPEVKLIFQLAASAMMIHMSNTMFKSAVPGMDDIMRQNPDLMQQFNKAAVESMGKTNPGFSGFMQNVMNPEPSVSNSGPLPPPIATQEKQLQSRRRTEETEFVNRRPDLNASRGGIDINNNNASADILTQSSKSVSIKSVNNRPEMKGPSDVSDLLSGLKPKPRSVEDVNIPNLNSEIEETGSTISISELKDLQNNATVPKRSKRAKQRSNKNTISLDI